LGKRPDMGRVLERRKTMRRENLALCLLAAAFLVAGGCTLPDYFNLNFFQTAGPGNDRMVYGSVESVSASTRAGLEKIGMTVKADNADNQGEDVRLAVKTRAGEQFYLVFSRVQSDQGEKTRVRIENHTDAHQQIVFNLLSQLEVQKSR
jgi:hypothetical protein